jgi:hypothetical protein
VLLELKHTGNDLGKPAQRETHRDNDRRQADQAGVVKVQ